MAIHALKPVERRLRKLLVDQAGFTGTLIRNLEEAIPLGDEPSILMLRAERIGDVLVTVPIIRAVRRRFPRGRLDILLTDANLQAAHAIRPWIDHVWVYHKGPVSALALISKIRAVRYDVLVDFQNGPSATSQFAARWSGAEKILGLLHERPGHLTHAVPMPDRRRVHIVDRLAKLLVAFGIDPEREPLDLEYGLSDDDRTRAAAQLQAVRGSPRLAVNISGRGTHKYWGRTRFIEAIQFVREHYPQLAIVVCGAPGDAPEVEAIVEATGTEAVPPLPFHAFASIIHECDLLLTPDTSVVHLAAAWKIPAVVLFGKDPHNLPWLPYRSPHRAIIQAGPLASIPLERVKEALAQLIEESWPPIHSDRDRTTVRIGQ